MGRRACRAEWVTGDAFDPTLAPGGRFDARWLDRVVADRPVVLRTMDHHTMWVNSETLRRAHRRRHPRTRRGADRPPRGRLAAGHPARVGGHRAGPGPAPGTGPGRAGRRPGRGLGAVRRHRDHLGPGRLGDPHQVDAWLAAAADGSLRFRANLAFRAEPTIWKDQLGEFAADRQRVRAAAPGWLTARTVKFFADGVVESGTAAMLQHYDDCPHSHGMPTGRPPSSPTR